MCGREDMQSTTYTGVVSSGRGAEEGRGRQEGTTSSGGIRTTFIISHDKGDMLPILPLILICVCVCAERDSVSLSRVSENSHPPTRLREGLD